MKVFLLIAEDQDDFDVVYGVFSTPESVELANIQIRHAASIKELELDKVYVGGA